MKVEFVTGHTHRGVQYSNGQIFECPDNTCVKLISRGVAKKVKAPTFKKAAPKIEFNTETSIGETADGPAND